MDNAKPGISAAPKQQTNGGTIEDRGRIQLVLFIQDNNSKTTDDGITTIFKENNLLDGFKLKQ